MGNRVFRFAATPGTFEQTGMTNLVQSLDATGIAVVSIFGAEAVVVLPDSVSDNTVNAAIFGEYRAVPYATSVQLSGELYTRIQSHSDTDNLAEQRLVGRITGGETTGLTPAQAKTLLAIDHGADVTGLTDDDHTQYLLLAPTTDTRNVIQPSAATVKALVLKGAASQSDNLLELQNSTGAALSYAASDGSVSVPSLGVGTDPSAALYAVLISKTLTDDTVVRHSGIEGRLVATPAANTGATYIGAFFDTWLNNNVNLTAPSGGLVGFEGLMRHLGTGTVTKAISGLFDGVIISGGGTVTAWDGVRITAPTVSSGTLGTAVGLYIDNQTAASTNYALVTSAGGVVFNNGGDANTDTVVKGDADAALIYAKASTDRVGIGDSAPGEKLDVAGNINTTGVLKVDDVQVVSNRVVDARIDDTPNSGDATTDGIIAAIQSVLTTHGLAAAA